MIVIARARANNKKDNHFTYFKIKEKSSISIDRYEIEHKIIYGYNYITHVGNIGCFYKSIEQAIEDIKNTWGNWIDFEIIYPYIKL